MTEKLGAQKLEDSELSFEKRKKIDALKMSFYKKAIEKFGSKEILSSNLEMSIQDEVSDEGVKKVALKFTLFVHPEEGKTDKDKRVDEKEIAILYSDFSTLSAYETYFIIKSYVSEEDIEKIFEMMNSSSEDKVNIVGTENQDTWEGQFYSYINYIVQKYLDGMHSHNSSHEEIDHDILVLSGLPEKDIDDLESEINKV